MSQRNRPFSYPVHYVNNSSDYFNGKILQTTECAQPIVKNDMQYHIEKVIYSPGAELVFSRDNTASEE